MTHPAIFAVLDFEAALARATAEGKFLLVDMTASWCGPCQVMDRTTWVDPKVVETLETCAVVIQVDVDKEAELAERLHVKSMPTVVAFEKGVERDRVVGLKKSAELLSWVDALAHGETSLQRLKRDAAAAPSDMQLRMSLARGLAQAGERDAAAAEYAWLWEHVLEHEPAMYGVRRSYLVAEVEELVRDHAPARAVFEALRAAAAPGGEGELGHEQLADWFCLNKMLGEPQAILAWFDANRERALSVPRLLHSLEVDVVPLLVEADRWADVAVLYPEPLDRLQQAAAQRDQILAHAPMKDAPQGFASELAGFAHRSLRETARRLMRALRAANRTEEAEKVDAEARKLDASSEMAEALAT